MPGGELVIYLMPDPGKEGRSGLLQECISAYFDRTGVPLPASAAVVREPHRKPRLSCGGVEFSVSHSRGIWACGFGCHPLGIDVEYHRDTCKFEAVARRFFHPEEYRYLENYAFAPGVFYPLWTAKESYVKFTGEGISDLYSSFSVVEGDKLSGRVRDAQYRHIPVREGYSFCVCAQEIGEIAVINSLPDWISQER
jgi:phosphopantetheinyl transferase